MGEAVRAPGWGEKLLAALGASHVILLSADLQHFWMQTAYALGINIYGKPSYLREAGRALGQGLQEALLIAAP